jgi:hypothetical protein
MYYIITLSGDSLELLHRLIGENHNPDKGKEPAMCPV